MFMCFILVSLNTNFFLLGPEKSVALLLVLTSPDNLPYFRREKHLNINVDCWLGFATGFVHKVEHEFLTV